MTASTCFKEERSRDVDKGGALVLRLASGAVVGILFDASDMKSARAMIQKAEARYPLDSTELHFANFNASLLAELKKRRWNKAFMRGLAAATVELGSRLTENLDARCMVAATDHRFVGPDQQIGGYTLVVHADPATFVEDVVRSLARHGEWRSH